MPGLRELVDLAWHLFGVNPALVSADGQRIVMFERERRYQPFCSALDRDPTGRTLCAMCDQGRFLEARRNGLALRYQCHAGLSEFVVPVIRNGEAIALLQCGQVHNLRPTTTQWRVARQSLVAAGIKIGSLHELFRQNRVLSKDRQADLINLLELIANRLSHADEHRLLPNSGRSNVHLGRAMTFIEVHIAERLTLDVIARAAGVSTRSLARLFRTEVGASVVEFILRRRIARARDLLQRTDHSCAEIAFEVGFGSVQHFNRIFRRYEEMSPGEWRHRVLHPAKSVAGEQRE